MDLTGDYEIKFAKWMKKKLEGKPAPMQKLISRSYNSGLMVLEELKDIPFSKLSSSLYFLCQDMETEQLPRKYEALLELAGANEKRFMTNIHKELNDISRFVKDNNLIPEFCEFISSCDRLRCVRSTTDMDIWRIMTAYMDLLLQTCTYLVPNKFDFNSRICGYSMDGNFLLCEEYYPYIDDVARKVTEKVEKSKLQGNIPAINRLIEETARQYGYRDIYSFDAINDAMQRDNYYTAQIAALMTFINEYTYDMLPSTHLLFNRDVDCLEALQIDDEVFDFNSLPAMLNHRSKTLPTNGIVINFAYESIEIDDFEAYFQSLTMKEVLHDDRIIVLYKIIMANQELCGYYDLKDEFFHSLFLEITGVDYARPWHEKLKDTILYLYAAATSSDGEQMFAKFGETFSIIPKDNQYTLVEMSVHPFLRGGKLRNMYDEQKSYNPTGARAGNDKYEYAERSIQGYIRKVGAGKKPSREAVERAKALGFSLAPDETYVQPFVKQVLKLKRK